MKNCAVKNSLIRFIRDRWLVIEYFSSAFHTVIIATTTKRTWSLKVYGKILTELGRSMTQEKCTKIVSAKIVRQPHQEQDGESAFSSSSKIALIDFNRTLRVWLTCFPYIHYNERVVHACMHASWCPCTQKHIVFYIRITYGLVFVVSRTAFLNLFGIISQ